MRISAQEYENHIIGVLEGSLTNESLGEFEAFLGEIAEKRKHFLLDLSQLSFVMSSGLSAILSFNNSLHQKKLHFIIYGLNGDIEKLFVHTGIMSHLTFCATRDEALEKLPKT